MFLYASGQRFDIDIRLGNLQRISEELGLPISWQNDYNTSVVYTYNSAESIYQ